MARPAMNISLIALLCGLSLAADCTHAGLCSEANDETSLLQVNEFVTKGSERAQPAEAGDKKADEDMETQTEELIPLVVNGNFIDTGSAAAAYQVAAADGSLLNGLAAEVAAEARPMNPEMWDTPVTNMKAVADAVPAGIDLGAVQDSFGVNEAKVRDTIVDKAQRDLDFTSKVQNQRQAIKIGTANQLRADRVATAESIAQDRRAVAEATVNRMATVADSVKRVNAAKELAIAHGIKQKQAMYGAVLGRVVGAKEGAAVASMADFMQKRRWMRERAAMAYGRAKLARLRNQRFKKIAVDRAVDLEAVKLKMAAERQRRESKAMKINSAAQRSFWEDEIEGPEATKNKLMQHEADRIADKYKRMTQTSSGVTEDLSNGAAGKAVADDFSPDAELLAADGDFDFP